MRLSKRMNERYPEEMTIVIQHTFWNLDVGDNAFEIDLSFDDIRERLRVPYAAIKGFFDPSVKFGLQFDVVPTEGKMAGAPADKKASGDQDETRRASTGSVPQVKPKDESAAKKAGKEKGKEGGKQDSGAEVVSLDTFRKKK